MNESELYKELGALTKEKDLWEESIPYVSSLLAHESVKSRQRRSGCSVRWALHILSLWKALLLQLLPSATVRHRFCGSARSTLWAGSDGETIL